MTVISSGAVSEVVPSASSLLPSVSTILSTAPIFSVHEALVGLSSTVPPNVSSAAAPPNYPVVPSAVGEASGVQALPVRFRAVQAEDSDSESQGGETDPPPGEETS